MNYDLPFEAAQFESQVRASIDQLMVDAVRPGVVIVGVIYLVLAPIYAGYPPSGNVAMLVGGSLLTGVGLLALALHWRVRPPSPHYAQSWGTLVLGLVLANNALFLALFPEPRFAGTLCAVLLAAGWFFLILPRFLAFVAATLATLAMTIALDRAQLDWFGPLMLVVASGGLAAVLYFGRVRSIRRIERLRMERKKAEDELRRRADFQTLLAVLSSGLIRARSDDINLILVEELEKVGLYFDLDVIGLWSFRSSTQRLELLSRWARTPHEKYPLHYSFADIPWIAERLSAGKPVVIDDFDKLPTSALGDQRLFKEIGAKSLLVVPLMTDGEPQGACAFSMFREKRRWSQEMIKELRLVAENLLSAVARSKAVAQLKRLKENLHQENLYLREEVRLVHGFNEIVGEDHRLRECLQSVEKVAPTDVSVLLHGETGTGKELFAHAVHRLSSRRDGPMISVNYPASPAELIESELFGHEKGAFTGAKASRRGRFELADKGTLFLDDIGELSLELQSKLLRVLQTGEFERLGGSETIFCDVRLIAATNRDLFLAQKRGEFRLDLYYRISSFPITLPPLRERRGDIPLLAQHFVKKHAARLGKEITAISAKMLRELEECVWPGNVRELESVIERALISAGDGSVLELPAAPPKPGRIVDSTRYAPDEEIADLDECQRSHIIRVLESVQWKIAGAHGAAVMLGVPPSTLRSKMQRLGISRRRA